MKKKKQAKPKRRRPTKRERQKKLVDDLARLLRAQTKNFVKDSGTPKFHAAVITVCGVLIWSMREGCPVTELSSLMNQALLLALQTHPDVSVHEIVKPIDPKMVN